MISRVDLQLVIMEMQRAEEKHLQFPIDPVHMTSVMIEEAGEAVREANLLHEGNGDVLRLRQELYQTIGTCFRTLSKLREVYGD